MPLADLDYHTPSPAQAETLQKLREAGKAYLAVVEEALAVELSSPYDKTNAKTVAAGPKLRYRAIGVTQFELAFMAFNKAAISGGD